MAAVRRVQCGVENLKRDISNWVILIIDGIAFMKSDILNFRFPLPECEICDRNYTL